MSQATGLAEKQNKDESSEIYDKSLASGMENLSSSKIEKVINEVLNNETGARFKMYIETCVHCGLCSEACHFFLSNDNDPHFSPVGKIKQTLWEMIKKKGKSSPEFIKKASEVAHTECNLCKRCAMYCPFGIDIKICA